MKHKQYIKTKHIVAGRQPLVTALEAGENMDKILMARQATGDILQRIRQLAAERQVPVQLVPQEKLNSITNTNHQGVVAYRSAVQYFDLQDIIDHLNSEGKVPLILLLDGITDVRNVGAIARTSLCCGVHALVLPQKGVAAINEDAIKTSAGALSLLPLCRVPDIVAAINILQLNGITVMGTAMKAEQLLHQANFAIPTAVVMGGEEAGISADAARLCNQQLAIPMTGNFESLNVGVATGMVLYEAQRQRLLNA